MSRLLAKFPLLVGVSRSGETLDYVGDDYVCSHCDGHTDASNGPLGLDWHEPGCPTPEPAKEGA